MAITGPYTKSNYLLAPGSSTNRVFYESKTWYRSRPIGKEPTPYSHVWCMDKSLDAVQSAADCINASCMYNLQNPSGYYAQCQAEALNKAYRKMFAKIYDRVELGLNLVEARQSIDMISSRANQIRKAYDALKKGRFGDFKDQLGIKAGGGKWSAPKQASSLWLEYHFGWEQLVKDIHDAATYLDKSWPRNLKVKGKGSASINLKRGSSYSTWNYGFDGMWCYTMGCTVSVTEPSQYILNTLGLINPASLAWEAVPFSFVADWFVPVGTWLNGFTDRVGLTIVKPYSTSYRYGVGSQQYLNYPWYPSRPPQVTDGYCINRSLSIPRPLPVLKPMRGISATRAATSIALLIQGFRSRLP